MFPTQLDMNGGAALRYSKPERVPLRKLDRTDPEPRVDEALPREQQSAMHAEEATTPHTLVAAISARAGVDPIEAFGVAVSFVAFLAIAGAALVYHATTSTLFLLAGCIAFVAAGVTYRVARHRLMKTMVAAARERGANEAAAKHQASEAFASLMRRFDRGGDRESRHGGPLAPGR